MKRNATEAFLQSPSEFKRDTGLSHENFDALLQMLQAYLDAYFARWPNKAKGVKPSIPLADRLLLTLYYLRHYPTFKMLGNNFGISESYANKVFHKMLDAMVCSLHVEGAKALMDGDMDAIVVDATEQPTERPVRKQKQYYSGKKKAIRSRCS